jgi:hypothetical protein
MQFKGKLYVSRIRRCLALPGAERRLFMRAYIALAVADLRLRIHRFDRIPGPHRRTDVYSARFVGVAELRRAHQYACWLHTASRYHVVRAQCLHRSLVLNHWLLQEGLPSELLIGVRKEQQELKAHAWVELGGHVIHDSPAAIAQFTPLVSPTNHTTMWPLRLNGRAIRYSADNIL